MNFPAPHFLLFSESDRTLDRGQWRFVLQSLDGAEQLEAADTEPDAQGERLELLAVVRGLEALPQPSRVTLVTPSRYVNRGLNYGLADWRSNDWQWEHFGEMAPVKNRDLWQRVDRALEFHSVECRPWRFDGEERTKGSNDALRPLDLTHDKQAQDGGKQAESHCAAVTEQKLDEPHRLAGPHFCVAPTATSAPRSAERPARRPDDRSRTEPQVVSTVKSPERAQIRRRLGCQVRRRWFRLLRKLELVRESLWLRLGQLGTRLIPPPWME